MFHTALSTSLWMGDLDQAMDEASIVNAFAQFGEAVVSVKIICKENVHSKNSSKRNKYNHCFVEFADVDTAQRVLHRLNGKYIPGHSVKRFKLNPASYGREQELLPEFSLYVGELTWDIDDYELYKFFQKRYKSVRGAKVVNDQGGKSKGYGFVRFSEENDQQRALIEMQHMTGLGRRPIKVSLASVKRPDANAYSPAPQAPPAGSYYPSPYWGGYNHPYPPPPHSVPHGYQENMPESVIEDDDSEVLEDPCLEINIGKENREFIDSSESFFQALEDSRWQPLDNITSKIPD